MKQIDRLEERVDREFIRVDNEINLLRDFRHATNGTIHAQNGKIDVIVNQQTNTTQAIEKLTTVVEDAAKKLGALMTLKSMAIGAGLVIPPFITGGYFLLQWYLRGLGIE